MSATIFCIIFLFIFSSCSNVAMAGRDIPSSVPSTMRPASVDYVKMKADEVLSDKPQVIFHEKEVKGCMPKGTTHSSAPSRYVNYQTLGSSCGSKTHSDKIP
ncbi:hypothetical protein COLO4_34705 [Corchorus olitorius]|uniref:Uncharacterized protein n=1 Tax=Corchorus olitorius TaxID=93759 RepID=A0A1R3GJT4_9ROSI|nr:hypothetical protein COLO4_34705 [Corchorus olitorius]